MQMQMQMQLPLQLWRFGIRKALQGMRECMSSCRRMYIAGFVTMCAYFLLVCGSAPPPHLSQASVVIALSTTRTRRSKAGKDGEKGRERNEERCNGVFFLLLPPLHYIHRTAFRR